MWQAFIDDSASDTSEDKRLVLAGYMQSAEVWQQFSKDWAAVLATHPPLASVHMSVGFPGFTNIERNQKIDALVAVIQKHKLFSFEVIVSRKGYNESVRPVAPEYLRHTYFPCFVGALNAVGETVIAENLQGPNEIIFDNQGQIGEDAARWFTVLKYGHERLSVLSSPPKFADDLEALPLQAADFLAWHVRKCSELPVKKRVREVAEAIIMTHRVMEVPPELFEMWGAAFQDVVGIDEARTKEAAQSSRDLLDQLNAKLPSEKVRPAIERIAQHGERLHKVRDSLRRYRLGWVWRFIGPWLSMRV